MLLLLRRRVRRRDGRAWSSFTSPGSSPVSSPGASPRSGATRPTAPKGVVPFHAAGAFGSFAMILGLGVLAIRSNGLTLGPVPADTLLGPAPSWFWSANSEDLWRAVGNLVPPTGTPLDARRRHARRRGGAGARHVSVLSLLRTDPRAGSRLARHHLLVPWRSPPSSPRSPRSARSITDARSPTALSASFACWPIYLTGSSAAVIGAVVGRIADAFAFTGLFLSLSAAEAATSQVTCRGSAGSPSGCR